MKDQHYRNYKVPSTSFIVDSNTPKHMGLQNGDVIELTYIEEINCIAIHRAINPDLGVNKNHTIYVSNNKTILEDKNERPTR